MCVYIPIPLYIFSQCLVTCNSTSNLVEDKRREHRWYTSVVVHKNIANGGESFTTMLNVVIAGLLALTLSLSKSLSTHKLST